MKLMPLLAVGMVTTMTTTSPAQTELTIYNQGFALVKDQRTLQLRQGIQDVAIQDVAQLIEANSVGIRSISAPGSFTVLEQNYQFDLISVAAILNKAVGQKIAFNRILPNGATERIEGTLLSAPSAIISDADGNQGQTWNGMVIQTTNGRILLNPSGEIEVSSIPNGLISKPTLMWMLQSQSAGDNKVELSYLTQGMSWKSDYVLSLDKAGTKGDIKGWVTLTNNSGATFENAKLKLLAGDVERVVPQMRAMGRGGAGAPESKAFDAGFAEEQFSDYHLYTLGRPATVRNREMKQVNLLEVVNVPITKRLVVDAMRQYRGYQPNEGQVGTGIIKPSIMIEFKNAKEVGLGMPLPMGTVKVFQRDSSDSLQMLGESQIQHTPKDETISLMVGRAFDIVVERKRTAFEWIQDGGRRRGIRETFEIELRNRKETADTVHVYERHYGQWSISKNNMDFTRPDSETALFVVKLDANQTRTITYTVETVW